jgi:hypothetical protein
MSFFTCPKGVQVQGIPQGESEMKVRFILLLVLLLAITVQSCEKDVDYVSIAQSLIDSLNAGDVDAAAALWADDGYFNWTHPVKGRIRCEGKDEIRECYQTMIDGGDQVRFSKYREHEGFLCFTVESSVNGIDWGESRVVYLRFEGEEITFRAVGCPGEY